jgi:cytochrome c
MDSFELNKVIGAVLGTCLVLLITNFTANALFAPVSPKKPGFEIAVKEEGEGGGKGAWPRPCKRGRFQLFRRHEGQGRQMELR